MLLKLTTEDMPAISENGIASIVFQTNNALATRLPSTNFFYSLKIIVENEKEIF